MLDMGFEPQIRKIIEQIRPDRQGMCDVDAFKCRFFTHFDILFIFKKNNE